jgi:LysR family glycine cleavage system transcriptional activator
VRLFNVDGPSPWNYYFVCPPALLGTQRVQVFRAWLFDEIMRFKQLYECTPAACDAPMPPPRTAPEFRLKAPL